MLGISMFLMSLVLGFVNIGVPGWILQGLRSVGALMALYGFFTSS